MTVQLNVSCYGNMQDHLKSSHTDRLGICECALVCLHLNDLAYCHIETRITEQTFSVARFPPCTKLSVKDDKNRVLLTSSGHCHVCNNCADFWKIKRLSNRKTEKK